MMQVLDFPISSLDKQKLESSGFLTAEDIVLAPGALFGFSSNKSDEIKRIAMRALALEYITTVDIQKQRVVLAIKEQNAAIEMSVLGFLEVDEGKCLIERKTGIIMVAKTLDKPFPFSEVLEKARTLKKELDCRLQGAIQTKSELIDINEIREMAQQKGFNGFWQEVFSEILGNEIMKQALSVAMFSTPDEPAHVLVIGDPASAKTLARDTIRKNFSNITAVGANTTRAGLVCNMGTGQLGALAYSNNKLVLIDEFDKITEDNIEPTYELLSNGTCSVHSGKIHREIISHFAAIAFANPREGLFGQYPIHDIGLDPVLLSRFALIVKAETISGEERLELFRGMLHKKPHLIQDINLFDQWLQSARHFYPNIDVSEEKENKYLEACNRVVDDHMGTELRRDLRMGMYLRRIPIAIARASFQNVTDDILDRSFKLLRESISQWEIPT